MSFESAPKFVDEKSDKLESRPDPKDEIDFENDPKNKSTEAKLETIDHAFDELLEIAAHSPEAQKIALETAIAQMRQIAEQMKNVRDTKNFQELKVLMMKQWQEIRNIAGGDEGVISAITSWGKRFVEGKIIFYDMINDVKDELIDKAQEIQEAWNDMQIGIGAVSGILGVSGRLESIWALEYRDFNEQEDGKLEFESAQDYFSKFIKSLLDLERGFGPGDIDVRRINNFFSKLNLLFRKLSERLHGSESIYKEHPEVVTTLEDVVKLSKVLSQKTKEASKIFKVVKKIQDTHFLQLYNEAGSE